MLNITSQDNGSATIISFANSNRGYLTAEGCGQLKAAVDEASKNEAVRAIIITGERDVFIRHYDVSEILSAAEAVAAGHVDRSAFEAGPFVELMGTIVDAPKPVIAAINGTCMGGGFELALACDFRIAKRGIKHIGLPESRIGIIPGGGGTQRLPRLIGEARALEFILLGQTVSAEDAKEMGLVTAISNDPAGAALELSKQISARGMDAVAIGKRLVRGALSGEIEDGLRAEQHGFYEVLKSQGAVQGLKAFFENGEDITL